jgi:hypothetical protein
MKRNIVFTTDREIIGNTTFIFDNEKPTSLRSRTNLKY